MKKQNPRKLITSAMLIAIGLVLPFVFHSMGPQAGQIFLPMHIPILVGAFVLPLPFALAVAILTPILSSVLTGMPPLFPMMVIMLFELTSYTFIINLVYQKLKMNIYLSLVGSMITGRIVAGLIVWGLSNIFMTTLPSPLLYISSAITIGIVGIIVQIAIIPPLILILKKNRLIPGEKINV